MSTIRLDSGLFLDEGAVGNPPISQKADDQPSSQTDMNETVGADVIDRIKNELREELKREMQSEKDKGVAQANKNAKEAKDLVGQLTERLKAQGVDTSQIEAEANNLRQEQRFEDLQAKVAELNSGITPTVQDSAEVDYAGILEQAGFNLANMNMTQYKEYKATIDEAGSIAKAKDALIEQRLSQQKEFTGSGIAQPSRGSAPSATDAEEAMNWYNAEKKKLGNRPQVRALAELKAQARKKGANIY